MGRARFSPWLDEQADFQMGHLLELARYRRPRRIKHLVTRFLLTRARIEGWFEGRADPEYQASTPKLMQDKESK